MDSLKSYELLHMAKDLARAATEVQDTLENSFLREQIVEVVEGFYDIGKVRDAFEIFGGYVNRSFKVIVEKDGREKEYFVRKYKLEITENEIRFEHAMVAHALDNGFQLLAAVVNTAHADTFVSPEISRNKFAIYTFLQGEDKYTWDNPLMLDSEYASAAEVLASFHSAARDFRPGPFSRAEPGILELVGGLDRSFTQYSRLNRSTKFHDFLTGNLDRILSAVQANTISSGDADGMIRIPIHCDYHPGNMKFSEGKVVGIFDFDWAKIDLRLFDVCLALAYNSVHWGGRQDGIMLLEKCAIFLKSYQYTLQSLGALAPLSDAELSSFPTMMAMANFFLLNWDITAYYTGSEKNDYEYLAYLKHNVRQMEWIESHKQGFAEVADSVRI
jgi:homoserine kinase type II